MLSLALIRAFLDDEMAPLASDERWRRLSPADLAQLDRHGLAPLAAHCLRAAGCSLPAELAQRTRRLALRRLLLQEALAEAGRALRARGVRALTCRAFGPVAELYPHPECRPTRDLDLVVAAGDFPAAVACLRALGYEYVHPRNPGAFRRGPVQVDLMAGLSGLVRVTGLAREARNFPGLDALGTAVLSPPAADGVCRLRAPAEMLLAALHYAYKHRCSRHVWGLDLLLLARSMSEADARETLALSRRVRAQHLLGAGLRFAAGLAPGAGRESGGRLLAALPARDPNCARRFLLSRPAGEESGKDAGLLLALACCPGPAAAIALAGELWLRAVRRRRPVAALGWALRLSARLARALVALAE